MVEVTFEDARDWLDEMIEDGDLGTQSISNYLKAVKALFSHAFERRHIKDADGKIRWDSANHPRVRGTVRPIAGSIGEVDNGRSIKKRRLIDPKFTAPIEEATIYRRMRIIHKVAGVFLFLYWIVIPLFPGIYPGAFKSIIEYLAAKWSMSQVVVAVFIF